MNSDFKDWDDVLTRQEAVLVGGTECKMEDSAEEDDLWNTPQGILKGKYRTKEEKELLLRIRAERGYIRTNLDQTVPGIQREVGEVAAIMLPPFDLNSGELVESSSIVIGRPVPDTNRLEAVRDVTSIFAEYNAGLPDGVRLPWHIKENQTNLEGRGRSGPETG